MHDPNSAIPEEAKPAIWRRYDEWRGERHRRFAERTAGQLPRLRNRGSYRRVVLAQAVAVTVTIVGAGTAFVTSTWFMIPFLAGTAGSLVCTWVLRIITGSIGDAPVSALDEIQLAQRNSARSIAFIVLTTLMFIPYFLLLAFTVPDRLNHQAVYGVAMLLAAFLIAAGLLPSMLTAWWMSDPDPEDFSEPGDVTAPGVATAPHPTTSSTPNPKGELR